MRPSSFLFGYTCLVFTAALIFGGGREYGVWSDSAVSLLALPLLGYSLFELYRSALPAGTRIVIYGAFALIALVLAQLIPLPPAAWTALPGRELLVESFELAGIALPWWPLSLDPQATWLCLLALIPAYAVLFATLLLSERERLTMTAILLAVAVAGVFLGLLQLWQGPNSPLRFYTITSPGMSVGFFANRNHNAAMLYCTVPFAMLWASRASAMGRLPQPSTVAGLLTIIVALVGAAATLSRTGTIFAFVALLLSIVPFLQRRHTMLPVIALGGVVALYLVLEYTSAQLAARFALDALDNYRITIYEISRTALNTFFPVGSGFGTFADIYELGDRPTALLRQYVNHAHNDFLEILIEGGVVGGLALLAFAGWFGWRLYRIWMGEREMDGIAPLFPLAKAGSIAMVLLLAHSAVEFPLRTTALSVIFAFCCALLVDAPAHTRSGPVRRETRENEPFDARAEVRSGDVRAHGIEEPA